MRSFLWVKKYFESVFVKSKLLIIFEHFKFFDSILQDVVWTVQWPEDLSAEHGSVNLLIFALGSVGYACHDDNM